jgi:Holliday junction resolvasome RuvABC ATP-dependent DNA helicase subunit
MSRRKFLFLKIIAISCISITHSMGQKPQAAQQADFGKIQQQVDATLARVREIQAESDKNVRLINQFRGIAEGGNARALEAFKMATNALELLNRILPDIGKFQDVAAALAHEYEQLSARLKSDAAAERVTAKEVAEQVAASILRNKEPLDDKIKVAEATAKVANEGNVKIAGMHWDEFRKTLSDPKFLTKIAIWMVAIALCIYITKYGLPIFANYLTRPYVISETSRPGLFEWFKTRQPVNIEDLIFAPAQQKQLLDLLLRVQTAKKYKESLPNVLFYGVPGTGKTAFVKALAYESGLDYALTSGSEFAKITNLNDANNELRRLLNWANRSKNGLIIFIDEAESLFANRKLRTTSKEAQDFINTFLSLVSDQSQKNVMFIFATNYPFKLDDAITNRIGINIEFTLPEAPEREKILSMYMSKFAQENEDAIVDLHPDVISSIPKYANDLVGFSPRAIKFAAEEMIINARRQTPMLLTNEIVQVVIDQVKNGLQETAFWEMERNEWVGSLSAQY